MSTLATVTAEIERLHDCFERWYHDDDLDFDEIEDSLAEDFTFFAPNGASVTRREVLDGIRTARGSRQIAIRIERPAVLREAAGMVAASYQEWHDHDDYSTARRSTAVFTADPTAPGGLLWRHVHETWIQPPPA